jgi:hypothetical protein
MKKIVFIIIIILFGAGVYVIYTNAVPKNNAPEVTDTRGSNPPVDCVLHDTSDFVPCKMLVIFSNTSIEGKSIEDANTYMKKILESQKFRGIQILYRTSTQTPQAIVVTESSDIETYGKKLKDAYPNDIESFSRILRPQLPPKNNEK